MKHAALLACVFAAQALLGITPSAHALEAIGDCAKIGDDDERLACFDALTRADPLPAQPGEAPETPSDRAETPNAADTTPSSTVNETPGAQADESIAGRSHADAVSDAASSDFGRRPDSVKRSRAENTISATIVGIREKWPDDRVEYRLDNQQVWTQTHTQIATIFEGDRITLTKGRFGGYFLRSERGAQVKVKRTQ